jgi:hypothetical protein
MNRFNPSEKYLARKYHNPVSESKVLPVNPTMVVGFPLFADPSAFRVTRFP